MCRLRNCNIANLHCLFAHSAACDHAFNGGYSYRRTGQISPLQVRDGAPGPERCSPPKQHMGSHEFVPVTVEP